jgi:hypothetical protein
VATIGETGRCGVLVAVSGASCVVRLFDARLCRTFTVSVLRDHVVVADRLFGFPVPTGYAGVRHS